MEIARSIDERVNMTASTRPIANRIAAGMPKLPLAIPAIGIKSDADTSFRADNHSLAGSLPCDGLAAIQAKTSSRLRVVPQVSA